MTRRVRITQAGLAGVALGPLVAGALPSRSVVQDGLGSMVQLPYTMVTRRLTHPGLWLCAGLVFLMFW